MADTTILAKYIVLHDMVQGEVDHNLGTPTGGFTGSTHHNVAAAIYKEGTKIQVYDDTAKGNVTFVYLQNGIAPGAAIAAGQVMVPDDATNNTGYLCSIYTADPDEGHLGGPCAVALSAMTDAYYGWFWCGGPAPIGITDSGITAATAFATDDSVAEGEPVSTVNLTADKAGIGLAVTLNYAVGFAMKADG